MMPSTPSTDELVQQVLHNCAVSDAHHARDYSLCIYLLKMREFFRWEHGLGFSERLPKEQLGEWITAREQQWETLEEAEFSTLNYAGSEHGPYDTAPLNQALEGTGLIYSGGLCGPKAHFFIAELEGREEQDGAIIYTSGRELARELTAPPALSLGESIFLRRESLRRMIWERLEEWGGEDKERAIAHTAACYNFKGDFDAALEAMTDDELATLREHELGEVAVGRELGSEWEAMLATLPRSRIEFQLRAIRDHLVDCRYTLPKILDEGRDAALHFYLANFDAMRKAIFPELIEAYQGYINGDKGKALRETTKRGEELWLQQMDIALSIYRKNGGEPKILMRSLEQNLPRI